MDILKIREGNKSLSTRQFFLLIVLIDEMLKLAVLEQFISAFNCKYNLIVLVKGHNEAARFKPA